MKFPILVIIYVFVQTSSCTQSDVSAEELVHTNPMVSTSAYLTFNTKSGTDEVLSSNSPTVSSLKAETHDSSPDIYDVTTNSNSHSAVATAQITWNPVSSALARSPDYVNTFPSSSPQNSTQHSGTNVFNYQTPPSIFENLDHEENELDSDSRVTDNMPKGLKTTVSTDLPLLYSHIFETVGIESPIDDQHISHGNVHHLLSESKNGSISEITTKLDTSLEHIVAEVTSVSDHTTVESSASIADFSNQEVSVENKEVSTLLTRGETITPDSNLFSFNKATSENLFSNNMKEVENTENSTFTIDSAQFSHVDNLKSATDSSTELDAENMNLESNLHNSSLDPNFMYAETSKNSDQMKTLSFSEKTNGLELISELNLETTPGSSFFYLSEKINESTTTIVLKARNIDNLTSEKFTTTVSDTSPLDISPNTRIPPSTISTFYDESLLQNSSGFNVSQKNQMSIITEVPTSHPSYITSIKSSDKDILSTSTVKGHNKLSTTTDDSITTIPLETDDSRNFYSKNATVFPETGVSKEITSVRASISESTETEKTIFPSVHSLENFTLLDNLNNQTISSSVERDRSSMYDASNISNIEKDSRFSTHLILGLSEITTSIYSTVNTFDGASKLFTTTDPNTMAENYLPSTKKLSTTISNNVEESNTVTNLPSQKHMDKEISTDSFTEQTTAPQTIPYHWFPSPRSQSPTTVTSNVKEAESSTIAFIPSHKDIDRETSTDVFTEQTTIPQMVSQSPPSLTTLRQSATHSMFSSFKPIHDFNTEETSISKSESYTIIDETATSLPDSYLSSVTSATTDIWSLSSETHREGKHIPFSTASTVRVTDLSSEHGFLLVTTEKAPVNDTEVHYMYIQIEDINLVDRTDMITAVIEFPEDSTYKTDMKIKLARTHQWLDRVLTKEFRNWTRDPFGEADELEDEIPFGNVSIFYVKPTPETNASHITLTFIVYNSWRNRTLPVHFVLGTLKFYSNELKELINSSAVYFYHGLSTENYDLLSAVFDKYGIIIFTICLAVVGITILVCVVVFYRKKTRQSVHYLADQSKLQQNLQEAVGIDLTPASIILQDEKEEKGSKICDDESWLVPIADIPLAEDNNVPNVQDTKL